MNDNYRKPSQFIRQAEGHISINSYDYIREFLYDDVTINDIELNDADFDLLTLNDEVQFNVVNPMNDEVEVLRNGIKIGVLDKGSRGNMVSNYLYQNSKLVKGNIYSISSFSKKVSLSLSFYKRAEILNSIDIPMIKDDDYNHLLSRCLVTNWEEVDLGIGEFCLDNGELFSEEDDCYITNREIITGNGLHIGVLDESNSKKLQELIDAAGVNRQIAYLCLAGDGSYTIKYYEYRYDF